ncbi:putative AMP-activated kinase, glycogen-binding protein [Helianthus annuus]|uniref:AMP-activated kinase, glycogen-binding protein n=1 Tax=Helianthus annuus TaxID=4232 RepID=A0A251S079_HELAN|nr:SNF1-related protein kinase regulatory subunit beta-2 [Helianthus annuus]KAF5760447.1 putative AMP-activated kinase, glycogen-binding protein [Helianthus annuus]KAJ0438479.1 putative AMP-activated kinase, glycogen-binding protein [Helianthus annuus]KAJ0443261.1 putative AMP-activated kinase, glycogen-binding protein [Helianthus annuus]KAJ0460821.1 putative AMP-activated kinase, glycogen-binding protein [Helianthus annuus]KAJ0641240.1 putative AMP-activated kinase, glycogen-binding protein [
MGNTNGREDGGGGGGGEGGSTSSIGNDVVSQDVNYTARTGDDGDFMGHSPPPSPRVSGSPLMFTPQVPVAPLQRPDEMQSNNSWMHDSSSYEDMMTEQGIPTMITWSYDGKEVAVEGSWDNWKTRKPLQRSGKDFIILKILPSGVYQYRFIVDGQWRHSPDVQWTQDEAGNTYNILDLQEYVPEDIESISGFEPPQSPDSSYNNLQLGSEDYAKEPPLVPPHLQMTLLNTPLPHTEPSPRPQHVVINHLYMQKGKSSDSVVALGSTHRFLSKYVTVVLYKSIHQ